MNWLSTLNADQLAGRKRLAALIDPDDLPAGGAWHSLLDALKASPVTDIFIGGSLLVRRDVRDMLGAVRKRVDRPIVLFPGEPDQVVPGADALLFLSLISGRNPELLIGKHVASAMRIRKMNLEVVPTGYMLVGDGPLTTAAYISQTLPIPAGKPNIVAATAVAGEMLGLQVVYLDAGSGAGHPVPCSAIEAVRAQVDCPIIVGGGLNDAASIRAAWGAGADLVVVGTAIERKPSDLTWLPDPSLQNAHSSDTMK